MEPYRALLNGDEPRFDRSHIQDLALAQLALIVLALTVVVFLGA
jgi:hypothetical protein